MRRRESQITGVIATQDRFQRGRSLNPPKTTDLLNIILNTTADETSRRKHLRYCENLLYKYAFASVDTILASLISLGFKIIASNTFHFQCLLTL